MRVPLRIAWRYLFAKKGHNAINVVSGISAAAVAVVTAAMVCVLSVMNGFGALVEQMFSRIDPPLLVTPAVGKTFRTDAPEVRNACALPEVLYVACCIEDEALVENDGRQVPALVRGVDTTFARIAQVDSIMVRGRWALAETSFYRAVPGVGLAAQLAAGAHGDTGLRIYAPKRVGQVNMLRPDNSFTQATAFVSGEFAAGQTACDDHILFVPIQLARELFLYDSLTVTSIAVSLREGTRVIAAQRRIEAALGDGYRVSNRYEQQRDFYRMLRIEKLLTAILLTFILLIASFTILGSLSMLMIDKRADVAVLRTLGADAHFIRRVFLFEGWLISALGACVGLLLGAVLCLLQQRYGLVSLGNGEDYIIQAYPVRLMPTDLLLVAAIVLLLGFVAAWLPARKADTDKISDNL